MKYRLRFIHLSADAVVCDSLFEHAPFVPSIGTLVRLDAHSGITPEGWAGAGRLFGYVIRVSALYTQELITIEIYLSKTGVS